MLNDMKTFLVVATTTIILSLVFLVSFKFSINGFVKFFGLMSARKIGYFIVLLYTVSLLTLSFFTNEIVSRSLVLSSIIQIPLSMMIIKKDTSIL